MKNVLEIPFTNNRLKLDIKNKQVILDDKVLKPHSGTYDLRSVWGAKCNTVNIYTIAYIGYYKPHLLQDRFHLLRAQSDTSDIIAKDIYLVNPPIQSTKYKDYYYIPFYSHYVINKDGWVKDERTGRDIKVVAITTGKVKRTNHWRVSLRSEYLQRFNTLGRYRAMALTFLQPPSNPKKLEVNHINGIADDDRLENLEWVTPQQNAYHAVSTGLRDDTQSVDVMDVLTGEVNTYFSIGEAARMTGMNNGTLSVELKSEGFRLYMSQYIFKFHEDKTPWPKIDDELFKNQSLPGVITYNVFTGEVNRYKTVKPDVPKITGVESSSILTRSREGNPRLPVKGYYFYREDNIPDDLPTFTDLELEYLQLALERGVRPNMGYKVTTLSTGEYEILLSHRELKEYIGRSVPARKDFDKPVNGFKIETIF